jgi:hypothetical protein
LELFVPQRYGPTRLGATAFKEVAMNKAVAIANNDTVFLSWVYDDKIADCLGFAVYRTDSIGQSMPLPAWVGFKGGSNPGWVHKDTTIWPVQKFNWRDFTAKRGGVYTYDIVPMIGSPNNLRADTSKRLTTDHVTPRRHGALSRFISQTASWRPRL